MNIHPRCLLFVAVGSMLFLVAACNNKELPATGLADSPLCGSVSSDFAIKDRMGQPVETFTAGEAITFETHVTNVAATTNTLRLNGGCGEIYFEVKNGSNERIWVSPCSPPGHTCLCASDRVTYAPGQTKDITVEWNQQQQDGTQVPIGTYKASALDGTTCSPALDKVNTLKIQ